MVDSAVDKKIYESASTLVRRTTWHDQPVVTKSLKSNAQTPNAIARYHHEFNINQSLTSQQNDDIVANPCSAGAADRQESY